MFNFFKRFFKKPQKTRAVLEKINITGKFTKGGKKMLTVIKAPKPVKQPIQAVKKTKGKKNGKRS